MFQTPQLNTHNMLDESEILLKYIISKVLLGSIKKEFLVS